MTNEDIAMYEGALNNQIQHLEMYTIQSNSKTENNCNMNSHISLQISENNKLH